jgi:hypothetical protein
MKQPEDDVSVIQNCYLLLNTTDNGSDSPTKILGNLQLWFFLEYRSFNDTSQLLQEIFFPSFQTRDFFR